MLDPNFRPLPWTKLVPGRAEKLFRPAERQQTSYRPTVLIGIGGTGVKVLRRAQSLLHNYYQGEEKEIFQFLGIDTATQEVDEGEEPLAAGDFLHLGAFDAAEMIRQVKTNRYIAPWWPGGTRRPYRPTFAGAGAERVRAVGRLALFHYLSNTIMSALETKLDRAIQVNAQHGMGATSIKFYLIFSSAGGTGSGMALDLAYIVRMLGLRRQPTAFVTGVIVTDSAFRPKGRTANTTAEFSGNTYAFLRELNHFAITRTFHQRYDAVVSTEELPEDTFRPFDVTYLLGLHNSQGQALDSFEALADMIAAELMLEIASPLQGQSANRLDNVHANDWTIAGQPAAYSSFALSALTYPLTGIASWAALKAHAPFSRRVLLQPRLPAGRVEDDVLAFTQDAGVEEAQADRLIDRLATDEKGELILPPTLNHDQVDNLPESQLMGSLQGLEENAQAELAAVREAIIASVPGLERAYKERVRAEVERLIRDPQRGPRYTVWFLRQLVDRLSVQRDDHMVSEQALYQKEMDDQLRAWKAAKDELAAALRLPGWMTWRSRRIANARSAMVTSFNAYLEAAYQLERRTQAVLVQNAFIKETQALQRLAHDLVASWEALADRTEEQARTELTREQATETQYTLMHNIVGPEELQRTYERHLPDLDDLEVADHLASQFWAYFDERVPEWRLEANNQTEAVPAMQAYYFLAAWFQSQLAGKTLLERLQEMYSDEWSREVELRYRQTAPFWSYSLAHYNDEIQNNLQREPELVGYGEESIESWGARVARATGQTIDAVNNNNPHEMVFLKTAHGLPLFALRTINQSMYNAYRYLKQRWDHAPRGSNPIPLHVSAEWESSLHSIEPQDEEARPEEEMPAGTNGSGTRSVLLSVASNDQSGGDGELQAGDDPNEAG